MAWRMVYIVYAKRGVRVGERRDIVYTKSPGQTIENRHSDYKGNVIRIKTYSIYHSKQRNHYVS